MDSDEDITDSDVLDWYSGRVNEIWDSALDSFSDLDASMAAAFRQVMESVQERSTRQGASQELPSQNTSSEVNGDASEDAVPCTSENNPVMVTMTTEQLMSVLEDDDDWLDDTMQSEEENPISVKLNDKHEEQNESLPKNVKRVSQENDLKSLNKSSLADSKSLGSRNLLAPILYLIKFLLFVLSVLFILYLLLVLHNPSQKFVSRHIQNYIYPAMRALRLATLSWVRKYPSITDWHEETCLIPNPWYWARPLDCSSCSLLEKLVVANRSGTGVDDFSRTYYHLGRPFIVRGAAPQDVTVEKLRAIYETHQSIFSQGIARFRSSDTRFKNLTDVIGNPNVVEQLPDLHVSWRISRLGAARLLRQLFPRPDFIPLDTEVALHKYIFLDGSRSSSYRLPVTEFANVWVSQGCGRRILQLSPSASCKDDCKTIFAEISSGDILYYNWQFWEVQSLPVEENNRLGITFMGSFY